MSTEPIHLNKKYILEELRQMDITTFPLNIYGEYDKYKDSLVLIPVENLTLPPPIVLDESDLTNILRQDDSIEPIIFSDYGIILDGKQIGRKADNYGFSHLWGYCSDERLDAVQRRLEAIKVFIIE
ncbi:MAG: hypothetical protein KAR23_02640 [Candidatus Aenigmarchaeota archaeon]|nr:hypothetical protein [Candidatus Aenigmarchaeota archaeon]